MVDNTPRNPDDNANEQEPSDNKNELFDRLNKFLNELGVPDGTSDNSLENLVSRLQSQLGDMNAPGMFQFISPQDPEVSWQSTIKAASEKLSQFGPDPEPTNEKILALADANRLAESWLNDHTIFPQLPTQGEAWSRKKWLQQTAPAWQRISQPIIEGLAQALGHSMADPSNPELAALGQSFQPILRKSASLMYHYHLQSAISKLASYIVSGSEVGMNLLPNPQVVLMPTSIHKFSEGLDYTESDIEIYLALRENARQRLFATVSWLGPQLDALLEHFGREIHIDIEFIGKQFDFESMESLDLDKMVETGEQVAGSFFKPASTPIQLGILNRLETLLALIEGWVDAVTNQTCTKWMPNSAGLFEIIRRRRASENPAHAIFSSLVGLEIRPRRIRDAENLWAYLTHSFGYQKRDSAWSHPDLIPQAKHLDDPLSYQLPNKSTTPDALDKEIENLLNPNN